MNTAVMNVLEITSLGLRLIGMHCSITKSGEKRIDDINSFLLLLLFISLAEFTSAHRQHTWIDIEILIWDLFSRARLELENAFVRWKVVATEGRLLSMYLL